MLVGVFSTLLTVLFGSLVGILAGYYGRFVDSMLSRFGDIFAGLPFVLGAIVILTTFNAPGSNPGAVTIIVQVVCSIAVLSWPVAMRIMRSATLVAKQLDYVKAARGLGASTPRIIFRHLLPNTLAPVLVYATIALGAFIGAEATLAYLGIGVRRAGDLLGRDDQRLAGLLPGGPAHAAVPRRLRHPDRAGLRDAG